MTMGVKAPFAAIAGWVEGTGTLRFVDEVDAADIMDATVRPGTHGASAGQ